MRVLLLARWKSPARSFRSRPRSRKTNQLAEWYRVPWKAYLADAQTGEIGIGSDKAARLLKNADHFADHIEEVPVMVVACAHLEDTHPTDTELGRLSVVGGVNLPGGAKFHSWLPRSRTRRSFDYLAVPL